RKFLKGDAGQVRDMALRIQGSPDLYAGRGATASINFVTCHDGFTLADLVSYNEKHNEANGENGRDGANDNNSWNCGWEGTTHDPAILALRRRQMKNALVILLTSQGVPMLLMGDEVARSQQGNNNSYCHDNERSWFDWQLLEKNCDLFQFTRQLIHFRLAHPVLRNRWHLSGRDHIGSGYPDISWHGRQAWQPDWSEGSRTLAFMLCGRHARGGQEKDDCLYVAMNMDWRAHELELPVLPLPSAWRVFVNTGAPAGEDVWPPGTEPLLEPQSTFLAGPRSVAILMGSPALDARKEA
ncbi:MAG TPA: hypothetical protein VF171_04365, partial [Trueperaceae bacterium]